MPTLITGFSSFPGARSNPTQDLVESLLGDGCRDKGLQAVTLPVEWNRSWPRLREAIEATRATTVLMFGLHARAERLRVELFARNRRELGRADAVGEFPSGPAVLDGPQVLPAVLDWSAVAAALRSAQVPFEWSSDAGGYLCNDTLYRLAHHARDLGVVRYGFFHVPISDERVADMAMSDKAPEVFCSLPAALLRSAALALADVVGTDAVGAA